MANQDQIMTALRNAHAAGDAVAAQRLAGMLKSQPQSAHTAPSAPSLAEQRANIADGMTLKVGPWDTGYEMPQGLTEGLAGMGRRMSEIGTLGTHQGDVKTNELLDDSGYATAGGIAADVGAMALGGTALKAAGAIPKAGQTLHAAGQALIAPATVKQAAAAGSLYGAATNNDRVAGGIAGGIGGGIGSAIPKVTGAAVKPALQKGADALKARGVQLTPGEMLGGWVQRIEDGATSVPFVGDFIKNSKRGSIKDFNRSIINEALDSVGTRLDDGVPVGREGIAAADDIISKQYDDILAGLNVRLDPELMASVSKLQSMANNLPSVTAKRVFRSEVDKALKQFGGNDKVALGQTFKELESGVRTSYKRMLKNSDYSVQNAGDALQEFHKSLLAAAKRQYPDAAEQLARTDKAYAIMSRVRDAASYAGAQDGVFTPSHMVNAIKKQAGKNKYARGQGFGQDYAEGAKGVLPSTVPDSGTPLRAMTGAAALGGGYALDPMLLTGMLGAAGLYTQPGQKALFHALGSRPEWAMPLRKGLEKVAPVSGLLGAATGSGVMQ